MHATVPKRKSAKAKLEHAWCRVYNLIATGRLPPKTDPEIDPEAFPRNPGE